MITPCLALWAAVCAPLGLGGVTVPAKGFKRVFTAFRRVSEDERKSGIKPWRRFRRYGRPQLPAVRAVYGGFQVVGFWRLFQGVCVRLASAIPKPPMVAGFSAASNVTLTKIGVIFVSESKERLTYRPEPETRQKIEQWYEADNCRSMNEFIDKAVSFYADYLSASRNDMLPMAISSAMNGRLKILEKNLSSLSFRYAVELDMLMGIIADTMQLDRDDLKRRRAQSVKNVRQTNGRVSLEKRAQLWDEDDWSDDEWQS